MRVCPNCGRGKIKPIQHQDYETILYHCDCCSNEMLIPDHVLQDASIRHDDIGIAGNWADCWGVRKPKESVLNEVTDLGGESIFSFLSFDERFQARMEKLAILNILTV